MAILSHVSCGHCPSCNQGKTNQCQNLEHVGLTLDGSAAQFVNLPARHTTIFRIPASLDRRLAALIEPLSCVLHGIRRNGSVPDKVFHNSQVLVLGGGPIGMYWSLFALFHGVSKLIIVDPRKTSALIHRVIPDVYHNKMIFIADINQIPERFAADLVILANSMPETGQQAVPFMAENGRRCNFLDYPD